jgi:hypothetical protein
VGSFNLTCFASRQTIRRNDPCLVVPILQQTTHYPAMLKTGSGSLRQFGVPGTACYPDDLWSLFGGPIEARYDDFGEVTLLDTPTNRTLLRAFLRDVLESSPAVAQGGNPSVETEFDFPALLKANKITILGSAPPSEDFMRQASLCWDEIWKIAREGRLFAIRPGAEQQFCPLQFAVLHHSAASQLVAVATQGKDHRGRSLSARAQFDRMRKEARASVSAMATRIEMNAPMRRYHFADHLKGGLSQLCGGQGLTEHLMQLIQTTVMETKLKRRDALYEALRPFLDFALLNRGLRMLNLYWQPNVTSGQDYSNDIGKRYARFVQRAAKAVAKSKRVPA